MRNFIVCTVHLRYIVTVIKSRKLRCAGHVVRMEEGRIAFKILTDKPTGKGPLGMPWRRWKDNIRMDLKINIYQYKELVFSVWDRDH